MSISELMQAMASAGAPMEAILIAVKAIEDERQKDADRRLKRAGERRAQRARRNDPTSEANCCDMSRDNDATVTRQGSDSDATVAAMSCDASPSASPPRDIINPPITSPSSSLRSDNRAKRVLPAGVKSELDGFTEEFNSRFWPEWRNKVGKPEALKSWLRVRRQGVPLAEIMAGVERYTADQQTSGRPWLNPATFLNQRRWEDAPAPQPMARASPPKYQDSRNGVGNLLAKAYGIGDENGRDETGYPANVRALPIAGDGQRGPDRGNDGGVCRNPAELLVSGSFRRM